VLTEDEWLALIGRWMRATCHPGRRSSRDLLQAR